MNFVIKNKNFKPGLDRKIYRAMFGENWDTSKLSKGILKIDMNEPINVIELEEGVDIYDILVMAKAFKSRSDAKRNSKYRQLPQGVQYYKIGKRRCEFTIFNPI